MNVHSHSVKSPPAAGHHRSEAETRPFTPESVLVATGASEESAEPSGVPGAPDLAVPAGAVSVPASSSVSAAIAERYRCRTMAATAPAAARTAAPRMDQASA